MVIDLRAPASTAGWWRLASWRGLGLLPDVARIAVLRANGIGDMLFALPALDALRAAYPAAEITLLGCPWHAEFFADRPGPIDRVVVVPPSPGVRDGQPAGDDELDAFFTSETAYRYDLAVQIHGGGRNSNPFVRRLDARVAVGSRAPDAPALDADVPYDTFQNEVVRFLEVVSLVGAQPVSLEPSVALRSADRCEADALLDGLPLPVALHPGASDPRRRWPPASFAEVGDALAAEGATVLVIGGPQDKPLAAQVLAAMRAPARDLTGRVSVGGLSALLARCAVLVGNDSGPLNLGAAVGTPTVGVYWVGNVLTASPLVRSRHLPHAAWRVHCPDCGADTMREGCGHRPSFVADVPATEVAASALRLLREG